MSGEFVETDLNINESALAEASPEAEIEVVNASPKCKPDKVLVDKTIRNCTYTAMASCLVPSRVLNMAALTAINLDLTRRLSRHYGVEFKEGIALKLIASVVGMGATMLITPRIEDAILSATVGYAYSAQAMVLSVPLIFGGTTYAIGRMFVNHFEHGGTFLNANASAMKDGFKDAYQGSREWLGNAIAGKKKLAGN